MERTGQWPNGSTETNSLVVATFDYPPFTLVDPARPSVVTGFLKDLMDLMAEEVGIAVVYDTNNTVGDFGVQLQDGTFTGLVGRLVNKTAHVALAPLTYREARRQAVDYIGNVPVATQRFDFLVPGQARASMNSIKSLLTPFDVTVWICLVCGMLLAATLLRVTVSLTQPRDPENYDTFGVVSSVLHVFACVVQQGWATIPSRSSPRIVMMAARLMCFIVYVEYTAMMIAVMTVLQTSTEIGSVQEFVARSDWSLLMQKAVAYSSDWKTSGDASLRTMYQRLETGRGMKLLTANTAYQMFDPNTVTSFDLQQAFFLVGSRACDLVPLPMQPTSNRAEFAQAASGRRTPLFLAMQKNMRIKPQLDRVMQRLYQTGSIQRLFNRWFWNATTQQCDSSGTLRALSFEDVSAMLLIVPAGVVVSMVVLLLEYLAVFCVNSTEIQYHKRMEPQDVQPVEHDVWRM